MNYCGLDFGTSNSAVAVPAASTFQLVALEGGSPTIPTAVFFDTEDGSQCFGRAAILAYVDGQDGRLMRSLKSILGSSLADASTDVGGGRTLGFLEIVETFIDHLRMTAGRMSGSELHSVVLGRPVYFVDGDSKADQAAQNALEKAARDAGFREVVFQYEPIAAALDYEAGLHRDELVLVVDIGGGTSDFSLVQVGPSRKTRAARHDDVLANHSVHVAGTDFDRLIELNVIFPEFGYGVPARDGKPIPNAIYHDLSSWHFINRAYAPRRIAEVRNMRYFYKNERHHRRLLRMLEQRLGHAVLSLAEMAKIEVGNGAATSIDLQCVERELFVPFEPRDLVSVISATLDRIVLAALETVRNAGVAVADVDALYFTGGSTKLGLLTTALADAFPNAVPVQGDHLGSVATGLGRYAATLFRA